MLNLQTTEWCVVRRAATVLRAHRLIPALSDATLALFAPDITIAPFVELYLPARTVSYDAESIRAPKDYARLVARFAAATRGEWTAENLDARMETGAQTTRIAFDFAGAPVQWQIPRLGDWAHSAFDAALARFAADALNGRFVRLPTLDQTTAWVYLENAAARDFQNALGLTSDEIIYLLGRVWATSDALCAITVREFLAQHGLAEINRLGRGGQTPLNVAVTSALQGKRFADEFVTFFVEQGARVDVADRTGKTARDLAETHPALAKRFAQLERNTRATHVPTK